MTYRLVLLTKEERRVLDKKNCSKIDPKRLNGIKFRKTTIKPPTLAHDLRLLCWVVGTVSMRPWWVKLEI
jgi:hypothetical protein